MEYFATSQMRRVGRTTILLAIAVTVGLCSSLSYGLAARDRGAPETDQDAWVRQRYQTVLELVLPLQKVDVTRLPARVRWAAIGRIVDSSPESEIKLSVQVAYDDLVVARFSTPAPSLRNQLEKLWYKQKDATNETLAAAISIRHSDIIGRECQRLDRWARKFERLTVTPLLPDELILDGTLYELWMGSQYGNVWYLEYRGPGPVEPVQPYPLATWMEEGRDFLGLGCRD